MTLEQLKYFIDVAETKNITISAGKFYITPQGLSRSLKALQKELNTQLFQLRQGKIGLTQEGLVYYTQVKDAVSRIEAIHNEMQFGQVQNISIVVATYTFKLISSIFARYQKEHPQHRLLISEEPDKLAEQKLAEGNVDLAILSGPIFFKELKSQAIAKEPDYIYVPKAHPLALSDSCTFSDIKDDPFVSMNEKYKIFDCYAIHMKELACSPKIIFSSDSIESIEQVLSGTGAISMGNIQYNLHVPGYVKIPMKEKNQWTLSVAIHSSCLSEPILSLYRFIASNKEFLTL